MPTVVFELVSEVLAHLPDLIKIGTNVTDLVNKTEAVIKAVGAPGDSDWAALDAQVQALRTQLDQDP